ncbi:hypothetical protein R1flu_013301 [Riccia fluitans]|uniref:Uncharacterized protein n=1 Tax=Riccia fluitans TaxID=41844 RepID=A0ABD1YDL7_9MARC
MGVMIMLRTAMGAVQHNIFPYLAQHLRLPPPCTLPATLVGSHSIAGTPHQRPDFDGTLCLSLLCSNPSAASADRTKRERRLQKGRKAEAKGGKLVWEGRKEPFDSGFWGDKGPKHQCTASAAALRLSNDSKAKWVQYNLSSRRFETVPTDTGTREKKLMMLGSVEGMGWTLTGLKM